MAIPKKLPSGRWRVQVFSHMEGDKRKYRSFTADTKADAARLAAEYQTGERNKASARITVKDCVEQYIDSRRGVLSPSTIKGYQHDKKHLESLGRILVCNLTSADVQYWISQYSQTHSPKTVRNVYSLLMSAVKQVDDRRFRVTLPAKRPVEYHTPTDEQVVQLLENADPDMRIAIILAAVGTLRRGEVCALDYEDVLYDFNAVYVHRSAVVDESGNVIIRDMPKTSGSVRRVVLPKEVIEEIGHGTGLVFKKSPSALESGFRRLRDSLGLKCRYHDLRHYAASIMHAIGVPDQYIMERGGWSSDRVLKEVYRNTLRDKSAEFTRRTNQYFAENISKNATRNATRKTESA